MNFDLLRRLIDDLPGAVRYGSVTKAVGMIIEASCPKAFVGELCTIYSNRTETSGIMAEIVGFRENAILLMPFQKCIGIGPGSIVKASGKTSQVLVGDSLIGRVVDYVGEPIDDGPPLTDVHPFPVTNFSRNPLSRKPIKDVLQTGIRAIDGLLTVGKGQRIGLMAGSGVGKSTLLSSICSNVDAEINVIALIGERGREVEEFVNQTLGESGMKNAIVVSATAQESPLVRVHAAYSAIAIAEYFASKGKNVLFTMDSITRFAMALREIGLAIGEPPTVKGYTPSVFSAIPEIVERCGNFGQFGSISAIFTVLVESDDFNDPIVDSVRAILDGHIVLSRQFAEQHHFPAIDVLSSVSRLFSQLTTDDKKGAVARVRQTISEYQENKDILQLSAMENNEDSGSHVLFKQWETVKTFLCQKIHESSELTETNEWLQEVAKR